MVLCGALMLTSPPLAGETNTMRTLAALSLHGRLARLGGARLREEGAGESVELNDVLQEGPEDWVAQALHAREAGAQEAIDEGG